MQKPLPVLYSFRRCPYAMRARLALHYSNIRVELREVDLKHKPQSMLLASPKATVPVLVLPNKKAIDESLDIMHWALQQSDPQNWQLTSHQSLCLQLIKENDQVFKLHLDHYKYADRFPKQSPLHYRQQGEVFLQMLELRLRKQAYLVNNSPSLVDMALLPFIRQFAYVDIQWFKQSPYINLRKWLFDNLESELFLSIMHKQKAWQEATENNQNPMVLS